jgi:hypothetical protein
VVQNEGRTRGDSGVDGDFKCLGVLKPVGVESLESVDVRAFDALNVIGGLMIMSSRLLLCSRRFFFCDASSAFVAETSQLISAFCDWMSYRWEGKLIGSLADDFLKGDPTFDRSFNLKLVALTVILSVFVVFLHCYFISESSGRLKQPNFFFGS